MRLIDDLLDFSRLRTGKLALRRAEVDFGAPALDLVTAFGARWPSGRLRAQMQSADPLDLPRRLGAAGAGRRQPAGQRDEVLARGRGGPGAPFVRMASLGLRWRTAKLRHRAQFLPHVFGLFSQAGTGDEAALRGGLGIGLAPVHGLVVAHGGFVKATSAGPGRAPSSTCGFLFTDAPDGCAAH